MGACVSQPEQVDDKFLSKKEQGHERVTRARSSSGSTTACTGAQQCSEPVVRPAVRPASRAAIQPEAVSAQVAACQHQACSRAAAVPDPAVAAGRISPWAAVEAPAAAPASPIKPVMAGCRFPDRAFAVPTPAYMRVPYSKEAHQAELLQLLEEACKGQRIDWTAIKRSLPKSPSADTPTTPFHHSAFVQTGNASAESIIPLHDGDRHDSASSSIEYCRTSRSLPKLPTLGKMDTAGSMPVYSYRKPPPAPSSQEFLRMLSVEGRAAYREWRGEEDAAPSDSCRSEDFNSACDAVISSLGNGCYSDWLTVEADVKSQSLLAGSPAGVKSPFETKIPEHIQRSLSSPQDAHPPIPRPKGSRRQRSSDGRGMRPPHQSNAVVAAAATLASSARPPLPRQASCV